MSGGALAVQANITKQREFDLLMRDEARKRDYGNGVPRWCVRSPAPAPQALMLQPYISSRVHAGACTIMATQAARVRNQGT